MYKEILNQNTRSTANKMKHYCTSLLLLLLLLTATATASPAGSPAAEGEFVRRSCRSTRYPRMCEQSLMGYAPSVGHSPRKLAHAAVTVGADRARACSAYLSQLSAGSRRSGAVKDCLDTMRDSVDRLRQSVKEMGRMGRARSPRFAWHLSNVQTWVSGALTDETTCLDSVAAAAASSVSPDVRAAVRKQVLGVAQVTSNALALVNQLGPHY